MGLTVLDAGPVIGLFSRRDVHHEASLRALGECRERGDQLVLPASALAEVLVMIWLTGPALRRELPSAPDDGAGTEYASMVRFFMPLLFAGFLATVTPPVINAAVARTSTPETSIAAIAIALSISQFLGFVDPRSLLQHSRSAMQKTRP